MSDGAILIAIPITFGLIVLLILGASNMHEKNLKKRKEKEKKNKEINKLMKKMNTLYQCHLCTRYFREWQHHVHKQMFGEDVCIHCGKRRYQGYFQQVEMEEGHWTNTNSDCPIISLEEWREQDDILQKHEIAKKEAKLAKEEMEYVEKQKESYWITKLKK